MKHTCKEKWWDGYRMAQWCRPVRVYGVTFSSVLNRCYDWRSVSAEHLFIFQTLNLTRGRMNYLTLGINQTSFSLNQVNSLNANTCVMRSVTLSKIVIVWVTSCISTSAFGMDRLIRPNLMGCSLSTLRLSKCITICNEVVITLIWLISHHHGRMTLVVYVCCV